MAQVPEIELYGNIQCQDVPANRAIRSFVAKHLGRWIAGHRTEAFGEKSDLKQAFHTVSLRRQGPGHHFACHVRLRLPTGAWSGSSFGDGLHQTILRAFQNLSPVSPPSPSPTARARIPRFLHGAQAA